MRTEKIVYVDSLLIYSYDTCSSPDMESWTTIIVWGFGFLSLYIHSSVIPSVYFFIKLGLSFLLDAVSWVLSVLGS